MKVGRWNAAILMVRETGLGVRGADDLRRGAKSPLEHRREQRAAVPRIPLHLLAVQRGSSRELGPLAVEVSCVEVRIYPTSSLVEKRTKCVYHAPENASKEPFTSPVAVGD